MNTLFDLLRPVSRVPREPAPLPACKTPPRALRNLHFMDERPSARATLPLAAGDTVRR